MKTKKLKVYETNLKTGEKRTVEIQIIERFSYADTDKQEEGDIIQENGIIRYLWKNVPKCLFQPHNMNSFGANPTALSYK